MSDDFIKRSDAIKAMDECFALLARLRVTARKALETVPSADIPQGEWIEQDNKHHIEKTYLCSNCEDFEAWGESEKYNFCPNCGARMKGADE